jgi:zinc transporter ZupT
MSFQELSITMFNQEFAQSIALGIVVAAAFPLGAALATTRKFPRQVKGNLAAIAAGIYFSTLAYCLVEEGTKVRWFPSMATGFAIGAVVFSIAHPIVKEHRKLTKIFSRSSSRNKEEKNRR